MAFELKLSAIKSELEKSSAHWQAETTVLSQLPDAEKVRRLGAAPPTGHATLHEREAHAMTLRSAAAPAAAPTYPRSHDWRNVGGQNFVTPVRDQSSCGSCVAFGTCATVETTARVEHGSAFAIDLSEAQLFYCDARSQNRNCANGWWPDNAFPFFQGPGVSDEACYPYTPGDQACTHLCADWQARATKITAWHTIKDAPAMKAWLATRGGLSACFTVYADFYSYHSGVYHHVTGDSVGGHCVSVVGYDDGAGCWICKNSWGTGFGEGGFFRIAYGQCGIDAEMWAVEGVVSGKVTLGDTSRCTPALAAFGNHLALGWAGTDNPSHINVMTSTDGHLFGNKVTLRETGIDGPALAGGNGRLFLAWTGTDSNHHLNVMSSADGKTFAGKVTLGDTAAHGPALAFGNNHLFLAWVGTDSHRSINVMSSTDGGAHWGGKVTLGETSDSQVGLCWAGDKLVLVWQGTDSQSHLNMLESTDGVHWGNKVTLGDTSDLTPALMHGRELVLAWTGRDSAHHLNTMTSTTGTHGFGHKVVLGDTATAGPALACFAGSPFVAWAGTDSGHHLNVMKLIL